MKKVFVIVVGLSIFLFAALAFARPFGMMGGMMGPNAELSADQQKFFDATKDLRKSMHDKRFEMMELYRNPNADKSKIDALEKEISSIRDKMQEKAKELNVTPGFCGIQGDCPNNGENPGFGPGNCQQRGPGTMQGRMMRR